MCFVCWICLGCFAWRTGWICRPLANWCTNNVQCLLSSIGKYIDWACANVKTRNDNGLRILIFSQKLPFSVGKKCFKDKYIIPIRHITNISDFAWFQRSCGSMKSVSSFSSIDDVSACFHYNFYTFTTLLHYYYVEFVNIYAVLDCIYDILKVEPSPI